MTQDIEDCLSVVLEFITKCDLPARELGAWCASMLRSDRVQYIATGRLQSLRGHFQTLAAGPRSASRLTRIIRKND
jgi:hypothetical protein